MTGDGAYRNQDGYYRIMGRVDDVVNISGHRLSTSEIESTLLDLCALAEVAVVGVPDEMTGQALGVFACIKNDVLIDNVDLKSSAGQHVEKSIGRFTVTKQVLLVSNLPKTRSAKIMRRILRKILEGEKSHLGDTSTVSAQLDRVEAIDADRGEINLLRPWVLSDIIGEVAAQTTTEPWAMTPDASTSLSHAPYPFSPYNLTSLDHIVLPCHIFMFLLFTNALMEGIDALRTGVIRLSEKFPFLTGLAVPSSQPASKEDVLEVQPSSSNFLEKYPILQVAYNPDIDEVSRDDFIQPHYLPIQFLIPPRNICLWFALRPV
ncbi:Acetyl-coenzyme A synthetase [Penicillium desertorum]|uniref:Acetyl-coenzyme A synthetase n=1 Tax=Penicillium desertorum TaxID=1303715 RepID=A0A9X0BLJ6_9EURO|nr:Acetyl-coenzyme A synthetase [Penicillium desertorum]